MNVMLCGFSGCSESVLIPPLCSATVSLYPSFLLFIQIQKSSANINWSNFLNPDGSLGWLRTARMGPFYNVIDYYIFNCKYLLLHKDSKCQGKQ